MFDTVFVGSNYDVHSTIAPLYGATAVFFAPLKPGITEPRVLAFQVPADVQSLMLQSVAKC